jgi:hypothetical protein
MIHDNAAKFVVRGALRIYYRTDKKTILNISRRAGSNLHGGSQRKSPAGRANVDVIASTLEQPLLSNDIPSTQVTTSQWEGHLDRLASGDQDLLEST